MGTKLEAVKVGGIDYAVKFSDRVIDTNSEGKLIELWGQIDYGEGEIEIANTRSVQHQQATVCHEIVHAILQQAGYDDHNEMVVSALGYGLAQVIRDNPALIDYLRGEGDDATSGT